MHGVKSSSAEKAEGQPTPGNSSVEPTRSSLKRKHDEESSSKQPQCRVLQIPNSEDLPAKNPAVECEKTPSSVTNDVPSLPSNSVVRSEISFQCSFCKTHFCSKAALTNHVNSDHQEIKVKYAQSYFVSLQPNPCFQLQCRYDALKDFYEHFCKLHLKFQHSPTLNALITVPHLVQNLKRNTHSSNQCPTESGENHAHETHLNNHCTTSNINFERCRICYYETTELDVETLSEHLRKHRFYYWHLVEADEIWQCIDCQRLSARCLVIEDEKSYFVNFHLKNIIITKSYSKNVHNAPYSGVSFQYRLDECLPEYRHEQKLYCCTTCSDTFETQPQLDQHLESHVNYVFRECSECQLKCYNMDEYYNHVYEVHGSCLMPDVDFSNKKAQVCPKSSHFDVSNAIFRNRCSLQILICHQSKFKSQSIFKLQCPVCDVVFLDTKLFYAHCVPYTKIFTNLPWRCIVCCLSFDTEKEARTHWSQLHSACSEFLLCRICKVRQKSTSNLEVHVSKQHNIPMIHCNLCKTNILYMQSALDNFKICYSSKTPNFICPNCGLICENLEFLITHIRVEFETLVPRYQCKFCLNFFYGKSNLASHMLNGKCK